jgi:hypothetical protein
VVLAVGVTVTVHPAIRTTTPNTANRESFLSILHPLVEGYYRLKKENIKI